MKFLGKFPTDQGNQYLDLLNKNGIKCSAEDVFEDRIPNVIRFKVVQSYIHSYVKLFVSEKDYTNSVELIKGFELQLRQAAEKDGREANKVMLKIFIGLVGVFGLIVYIGIHNSWW